MTTDQARGERLEIRRPGDVPPFTALSRLVEQRAEHDDRLMNNRLPADHPRPLERGTAADALAGLALGEAVRRRIADEHGSRVREALELGATWSEVAAALDVQPDEARELLRVWAEGQHRLYRSDLEDGRPRPLGLDDEGHAAVLALTELGDDGEVPAAAAEEPRPAVRPETVRYAEELRSKPGTASTDGRPWRGRYGGV